MPAVSAPCLQHLPSSTSPPSPTHQAQATRESQTRSRLLLDPSRPDGSAIPILPQRPLAHGKGASFSAFRNPLTEVPPWVSLQCLIMTPHLRFSNFLVSTQEELLFCDGRDHINPHVFWPASSRVSNFSLRHAPSSVRSRGIVSLMPMSLKTDAMQIAQHRKGGARSHPSIRLRGRGPQDGGRTLPQIPRPPLRPTSYLEPYFRLILSSDV